jgi:dinuclear metal center YbgI/SA1388 family protein
MKTYIKDLIVHLESLFPPEYQENYDNSGFLAGNMLSEVKAVMVCLNVTEDVIDEAIAKNCNLIISHHPLIFSGLKKITGSSLVERLVEQVIRSNMAVYAIHTNADNTFPGLNSHIASKLGLNNVEVLAPQKGNLRKIVTFCPADHAEKVRSALFDAGAGGIGKYDSCSFNAEGFGTFRGSDETQPFTGVPGEFSYEKEVRIETIFPHYLQKKIIHALFNSHPYEEVAYDIYALENQNPNFGSGVTGLLELPMDKEDFLKHVQSVFQTKFLKFSGACNNIKKSQYAEAVVRF